MKLPHPRSSLGPRCSPLAATCNKTVNFAPLKTGEGAAHVFSADDFRQRRPLLWPARGQCGRSATEHARVDRHAWTEIVEPVPGRIPCRAPAREGSDVADQPGV